MSVPYSFVSVYEVRAVCCAPLRTGDAENNNDTVLKLQDGSPLVQGTSIAGAFRAWIHHNLSDWENALFGSQQQIGSLIISDGLFLPKTELITRPRIAISGKSGTAKDKHLTHITGIQKGSAFSFSVTWFGDRQSLSGREAVEQIFSAVQCGEICFGAYKSNGFGRVRLTVRRYDYDLCCADDLSAWMEDEKTQGYELKLAERSRQNMITFTVDADADMMFVRGRKSQAPSQSATLSYREETAARNKNGSKITEAILPSTSIRGVLRSRCAMISDYMGLGPEVMECLFGRTNTKGERHGIAGGIRVSDAVLSDQKEQTITRIRIDRLTAGVFRKALVAERPLQTPVQLTIQIPSEQKCGCALMTYALRDVCLGLVNFGAGGSVGRGYLKVHQITVQGAGKTAAIRVTDGKALEIEDNEDLISGWMECLEKERVSR